MVRLVFRPYTQMRRTICTSVSLWASIRVSPELTLHKHSSPSFGSYQMCSCSNISQSISRLLVLAHPAITFIMHTSFWHPWACTCARLLGPCFKTGQVKTMFLDKHMCNLWAGAFTNTNTHNHAAKVSPHLCHFWKRLGEKHCKLPVLGANSAFSAHTSAVAAPSSNLT